MDDHQLSVRFNAQAAVIARLERKVNFILTELKLDYPEEEVPAELKEVVALVRQGDMMGAIKAYRQATGASLNDAKAQVEALSLKL